MNKEERKEYREYLTIADKRVLDTKKSGIELIADDEVFVLVKNTHNYWISNHGRLMNNLRGYFYTHKTGDVHYTLTAYTTDNEPYQIDTYCNKLVAEHFLEMTIKYDSVWHVDRNKSNNYYKNLVWVNSAEYYALNRGVLQVHELGRQQKYIPYITLKSNIAYSIWNAIYNRCYKTKESNAGECYKKSTMYDGWLNDKDLFAEWYMSNYYECDGESMAVDKDLLIPGNTVYSPYACCILPQTLNTMLSNCKKHRPSKWRVSKMNLPLGVRYDERMNMYYSTIKLCGYDETVALSYWDTPEEAFAEYKRVKQADILMMATKYKNKIPKHVYEALTKYEVKPFVED